jgi:hypothetical protein
VDYQADIDPPIGAMAGTSDVVTVGTYECGIARGTVCGSGVSDGSCLQSAVSSWVVSCDGTCTASAGNTSGSVTCDGTIAWKGQVSGQCVSGVCTLEGQSEDGSTQTKSVSVSDPTGLPDSVNDCGIGGAGVSHGHFVGVTSYPLPLE